MLTYILAFAVVALVVWGYLSKSGKTPSLKLNSNNKKFLFIGVGLVVAGILLYLGVNMFGGYLDLLPTSEIWFWPAVAAVIIIVLLIAFKGTRKFAVSSLGSLGVIVIATVIGTSGGLLVGSAAKTSGPESVCGSQHNEQMREDKPFTVTLCSTALAEANSVSIRRDGPKEVTINFATSTTQLYGDRLKGSSPSDFYFRRPSGHMGSNFFFDLIPNDAAFRSRGMSHIPLDFVIEYKEVDMPTR